MSRPDPCGAPAVAPLACIGLPLHIRQHHIPILAMLQGCRLPCRNRPFEFHPMAPWQDLGNSQTARHQTPAVEPGYRATVLTIKPDQASQQTVCGFAGLRLPAKAGNAAWAIALRWPPPLWRRSGRAANRARICLASPAAPSGSAWLRMGPAIATLPFLFSRRKLRIVDGVVKSGAADPQGRIQRNPPFLPPTLK